MINILLCAFFHLTIPCNPFFRACNCHAGGSNSSQCHLQTGVCTCKANANGTKCELCKPGTYNSDPDNPDGCAPCFCYGRSNVCSSAKNFVKSYIQTNCYANPNCKINVFGKAPTFEDVNQAKKISFSNGGEMNLTLPNVFKRNQLRSYGQRLEVEMTFLSNASLKLTWKVIIVGNKNVHTFPIRPAPSLNTKHYYVRLHERYAEASVTAFELQHDLANVRSIKLMAKSTVTASVQVGYIKLVTAKECEGVGEQVGFVENCSCPFNYSSLSCGNCSEGKTIQLTPS